MQRAYNRESYIPWTGLCRLPGCPQYLLLCPKLCLIIAKEETGMRTWGTQRLAQVYRQWHALLSGASIHNMPGLFLSNDLCVYSCVQVCLFAWMHADVCVCERLSVGDVKAEPTTKRLQQGWDRHVALHPNKRSCAHQRFSLATFFFVFEGCKSILQKEALSSDWT